MSPQDSVAPDDLVVQSDQQVATDIDGEVALLCVQSGNYYTLNPVGSRIWHLAAEPRSISEICAELVNEYQVSPAQCYREVTAYLRQMQQAQLVKVIRAKAA